MGCDICSCYTFSLCSCDYACYGYGCTCDLKCYGYEPYVKYRVQIDNVGTPNSFKWSDDGALTWEALTVPITADWQTLNNGVKIKFDSTIGHTNADYWDFYAGQAIYAGERLIWYYKNYGGVDLIDHVFHPGSSMQEVETALKAEVQEWNAGMRYTAYSYFRLTYDAVAWKGAPDFTAVLRGKKIYDPRTGTTGFSRNPALVWLDFITSSRYGIGVPINMINIQSVIDVANWCDSNNFYFNGVIADRKAFIDNMEDIMMNFRAFIVWSGGKYYLKTMTDDASVMSLTEADIDVNPESFQIRIPGIPDTPNRAKISFPDKNENFTANYAIWEDLTQIGLDGESRVKELSMIGINEMTLARKMAKFTLLRSQFNKEFTILAHPRCYALEPGDMITLTHEFPNWNMKKIRVKDIGYPQEGLIPLTLMEEDSSIYNMTI